MRTISAFDNVQLYIFSTPFTNLKKKTRKYSHYEAWKFMNFLNINKLQNHTFSVAVMPTKNMKDVVLCEIEIFATLFQFYIFAWVKSGGVWTYLKNYEFVSLNSSCSSSNLYRTKNFFARFYWDRQFKVFEHWIDNSHFLLSDLIFVEVYAINWKRKN